MLSLEYLLEKMKIHFPRFMDIRRRIKTSNGGNYVSAVAEEISGIQEYIDEYVKDFFIDKYIGHEEEIITYLYKFSIGITEVESIEILSPKYSITEDEEEFYLGSDIAYYNEGFIYLKEDIKEIEYSIDGYKSTADAEKIHVWNIFDEFAAFLGIKRYLWESNKELLNRIFAFANNRPNSTEEGIKNAIINSLTNIPEKITREDILIERATPENLNLYYDEFQTILDHLADINRDVYRTKRWDLDKWNFEIKSVDYIPHAWDVALKYYQNGTGFKDDLKVEIVDAEMKTDATIFFYKKTLEYINSYIKNNNIKEKISLDLVRHSESLKPVNVKYQITATEVKEINPEDINIKSIDYKVGIIKQNIDDIFDIENNEYNDIEFIDNSILDSSKNYKLRFISDNQLKEMSIEKAYIYNKENGTHRNLLTNKAGFEVIGDGVRATLTKKYISEKYHLSSIENAYKDIEGFVISDVELPSRLIANVDNCQNEPIYYEYECEEIPVLFQNIERKNCYIENDSILSDTVDGEKSISIKLKANSFSCKIHGPHKVIYSIDDEMPRTIEKPVNDSYDFSIDRSDMPRSMDIKIILNPINNMQCAITDIMYSKFEFEITTEKGEIPIIGVQKRMPNVAKNNLYVNMKTYIGFSPILKYIYIGEKLNNIVYGDIEIHPQDGDRIYVECTNCKTEFETYSGDKLEFADIDFSSSITAIGLSNDSYIEIDLKNFKEYSNIIADRCYVDSILQGSNQIPIIRIPKGVYLRNVDIVGKYEKLIFTENLSGILKKKGYLSSYFNFLVSKTSDKIIVENKETLENDFISIKRNDLLYRTSKVEIQTNNLDIKAVFVDDLDNNITTISNEYEGIFNSISFYPVSSKIYKAINEVDIISPITIVPSIINTFNNNFKFNSEDRMYYLIKTLNEDFKVHFYKNSNEKDYSIDTSKIKIEKIDMENLNFDHENITLNYTSILGNTVEVPEYFTLNNEKIEVARYMINSDEFEISYLNKYTDKLHENDYVITEYIKVDSLKCNKLKYCNVESIDDIYIEENDKKVNLIEGTDFSLLRAEGIINWNNKEREDVDAKVFVKYSIKKAKHIKFSIDKLYEKVNYQVNAYELINKLDMFEVNNNDSFNLSMYEEYKESDFISVKCSNIGFEAYVDGEILSFTKNLKNNTIAVKNGYYYLDNDEYYLFADENRNNIEQIDNIFFFNVIKENKKFYLNQTTENLVNNSSLKASASGKIFSLDCMDKNIQGISKVNSITTCDNFNYWKSVGMDMAIVKGLNGDGIKFTQVGSINGYAYINITKHFDMEDETYVLSFFMEGEGEAFLGIEKKVYSSSGEFNKQSIIEPKVKALKSKIEDNIYEVEFKKDNAKDYYLIVKGNLTVDDIIIQNKKDYSVDSHIKNISFLNLNIKENIYSDFKTRLYLDDTEGAILEGTEVKDGFILNSSYIDWGFTKTKELSSYDAFKKCILSKVDIVNHNDKCYVKTGSESGSITTEPIYVGNVNTIKNLVFKINNVLFDNMTNFKTKVLTSTNSTTGFKEISTSLDNMGSINSDKLSSYIKLVVEMPPNKVIDSIELFTEYLSDKNNNPIEIPVLNGIYTSKVLDTQYSSRYLVESLKADFGMTSHKNIIFEIRASKENHDNTVWTTWKKIDVILEEDGSTRVTSRVVFDDYRYFQFRMTLKGVNASVKIKQLDLEVI